MEHFIDREQEMETLQTEYDRNGSSLVILYGRRRVGKTTLISEFIKDKKALYFLASEESESQNRSAFQEKAAEFLDNDLLRNAAVNNWDILFKAIMDKGFGTKPCIVLDEFQYLGKANPAFPSVITGGVPKYIELFSGSGDIYEAIEKCVLNRSGYLYDEPYFLLQQEVSEVGSYFSIIKTIAAGNSKLSAISTVLEIKSTSLTKYLKTLMDLDIVEREVPVTEDTPEKSKKGLYKIKDNYLRFWFAFVYPNKSFIESGHSQIVAKKIRETLVSRHISFVYEDVCRERMWQLNAEDTWPFHFSKLGRYWDAKTEIDIAAVDPEGKNLILGECKYWRELMGSNILRELEEKAEHVPWEQKRRRTWYVLFSAEGFTDELQALAAERDDVVLFHDFEA